MDNETGKGQVEVEALDTAPLARRPGSARSEGDMEPIQEESIGTPCLSMDKGEQAAAPQPRSLSF